jgi:hypothetical protein
MKLKDDHKVQIYCAALQATITYHESYDVCASHARTFATYAIREIEEKGFDHEPSEGYVSTTVRSVG